MTGRSDHQPPTPGSRLHSRAFFPACILVLASALLPVYQANAEIRTVNAQGEYRLGDRDTREDAIRLATESAKRNALEQVATYLESITIVDGMDVTKDEIRTYTAGMVLVLDQEVTTRLDGDTIVVTVDLVAQIDTEEAGRAIAALRENEDARVQLAALRQENEQLQQDLEAANQALTNAATPEQAQQASQQRQEILNRVQSNALVSQAWTDWVIVSPVVYPSPWVGLAQTRALLHDAHGLYPASPHVAVAQQVITSNQAPASPPPAPAPAPGSDPQHTSGQEHGPQAEARSAPRTLNEISHTTPTAPPQIGNGPSTQPARGSRNLTDGRHLNSVPPPAGSEQQPLSTTRMRQFLQENGGIGQSPGSRFRPSTPGSALREVPRGQPPAARRFPPTINQGHPPAFHQVPRAPSQMAPRSSGGGGQGGGGGRSSGSGGGGGRGGGRGR